jgi:hypothetical protein
VTHEHSIDNLIGLVTIRIVNGVTIKLGETVGNACLAENIQVGVRVLERSLAVVCILTTERIIIVSKAGSNQVLTCLVMGANQFRVGNLGVCSSIGNLETNGMDPLAVRIDKPCTVVIKQ